MDKVKRVFLEVPVDYDMPKIYSTSSAEITSRILELGANSYTYIQEEGARVENEKLFQQLKRKAAEDYTEKIKALENTLESTRNSLTLQEQQTQNIIQSLKQRLTLEQSGIQDMEKRVREEEKRNRNDLLAEKDKQISLLREQLNTNLKEVEKSLKDSQKTFHDNFYSFKEQLLKTNSASKKKGEHGETVFEDILLRAFGSVSRDEVFDVKNVGREGHQGDICMLWRNHKVMWEIKNYERNVEQKEVTKFLRDMEEAKDFSLGVMVSMTSGITGHTKTGNVDIEELRDGRICIYLSHFMTDHQDTVLYLQSLKPFFETLIDYKSKTQKDNSQENTIKDITERFENHRNVMMKLLKKHEEYMRKFRNTIINAKKKSEQIWLDLGVDMREAENSVKLLLDTMLEIPENSVSTENSENKTVNLPGFIFKMVDFQLYSKKDQKFIKTLCDLLDFGEEYSMFKKDLKESLKQYGYSDDASGKVLEQILREDVWEKGKQKVNYIRFKIN
jgi:hypothetical protein